MWWSLGIACTGCPPAGFEGRAFIWNRGYETLNLELRSGGDDCELLRRFGDGFLTRADLESLPVTARALPPGTALPIEGCVGFLTVRGERIAIGWRPGELRKVGQPALPRQIDGAPRLEILPVDPDRSPPPAGTLAALRPGGPLRMRVVGDMTLLTLADPDKPSAESDCDAALTRQPRLRLAGGPSLPTRIEALEAGPGDKCSTLSFAPASGLDAAALPDDGDAGVDWSLLDTTVPTADAFVCAPAELQPFAVGDVVRRSEGPMLIADPPSTTRIALGELGRAAGAVANDDGSVAFDALLSNTSLTARPLDCGLVRAEDGVVVRPLQAFVNGEAVQPGQVVHTDAVDYVFGLLGEQLLPAPGSDRVPVPSFAVQRRGRYRGSWMEVRR